eukprot:CAMPEP_0198199516 /NCGR_PEP_ID=MMETSP1445-20131203/2802_1 /TAXON_ID=36898 /ORGANISM="Pyramimonas sp., Strain CCMP2087" /LENGTH=333 /DNA_ID=CAMNT_0043869387 /DNA_START=241 /DNA_END=1242 /DNA_ORIENTATION=+
MNFIRETVSYVIGSKGQTGFGSSTTAAQVLESLPAESYEGKVILITGCTSGLGKEVVRVLASNDQSPPMHIVMACRDEKRMMEVAGEIRNTCKTAHISTMHLDLSDLESVKTFAKEFIQSKLKLHVMINNAGVMACPLLLSKQGLELQFATNHLGHFLMTKLLLPVMADACRADHVRGRVVSVASMGHFIVPRAQALDFDNLDGAKTYSPFIQYGQSKLCNVLFALELDRRMQAEGVPIEAVSLHPGVIATELFRFGLNRLFKPFARLMRPVIKSIPQGAATHVYCALADVETHRGGFWADVNPARASSWGTDAALALQLWDKSEEMVAPYVD